MKTTSEKASEPVTAPVQNTAAETVPDVAVNAMQGDEMPPVEPETSGEPHGGRYHGDNPPAPDVKDSRNEQLAEEEARNDPQVAELLARAEERGYLRGRNERAEELMQKPAMFRSVEKPQVVDALPPEEDTMILRQLRKSVWDR